jgi:spoIIIJ-associated protein
VSDRKFTVESVGSQITEFLVKILDLACVQVTPEVREASPLFPDIENPELVVNFDGPDVDLLLANKAELLLALEHLTMERLGMGPREHSLIVFDANEHRMMRMEELRLSALTAADRVKSSHQPFRFNPMTSRERRILHLALRDVPDVRSESDGMGPQRGVVVYPADMPSAPAPPPPPPMRGRRR